MAYRIETKFFHTTASTKKGATAEGRRLAVEKQTRVCVRDMKTLKRVVCFTKTGRRIGRAES